MLHKISLYLTVPTFSLVEVCGHLGRKPRLSVLCGCLFFLCSHYVQRLSFSTETKDIPLCEGQYSCQTSTAGHVLQSPKRHGTLSPSTRTLTHRLAFYTLVSTRLGPIQPIVPNSRAPRAKETLSTSSNSILAKSSSTSASVPSSYASRASKKRLRPSKSISAKWISNIIPSEGISASK